MDAEANELIQKLQMVEENLHGYLGQKQQAQANVLELESALEALVDAPNAYLIVGNIMVERPGETIKKDVEDRLERARLRVQSFEKQEAKLKQETERLQAEIMQKIKG